MKKLFFIAIVLISFATVGCEKDETLTKFEIVDSTIKDGDVGINPQAPLVFTTRGGKPVLTKETTATMLTSNGCRVYCWISVLGDKIVVHTNTLYLNGGWIDKLPDQCEVCLILRNIYGGDMQVIKEYKISFKTDSSASNG